MTFCKSYFCGMTVIQNVVKFCDLSKCFLCDFDLYPYTILVKCEQTWLIETEGYCKGLIKNLSLTQTLSPMQQLPRYLLNLLILEDIYHYQHSFLYRPRVVHKISSQSVFPAEYGDWILWIGLDLDWILFDLGDWVMLRVIGNCVRLFLVARLC